MLRKGRPCKDYVTQFKNENTHSEKERQTDKIMNTAIAKDTCREREKQDENIDTAKDTRRDKERDTYRDRIRQR